MEGTKIKIIKVGQTQQPVKIGEVIDKWYDSETGKWVYRVQLEDGRVIEVNEYSQCVKA